MTTAAAANIELLVFSGVPNPRLTVGAEEVSELLRDLPPPLVTALRAGLPCVFRHSEPTISGYSGFRIWLDAADAAWFAAQRQELEFEDVDDRIGERLFAAVGRGFISKLWSVDTFSALTLREERRFEIELLDTSGPPPELFKTPRRPVFPLIRPASFWKGVNCYGYANDEQLLAIPGGGVWPGQMTVGEMLRRLDRHDHLTPIGLHEPTNWPDGRAHYVAVCMRNEIGRAPSLEDRTFKQLHCLRLDGTGYWTQKDGDGPVTGLDDQRQTMPDLRGPRFAKQMLLVGFYESRVGRREIHDLIL